VAGAEKNFVHTTVFISRHHKIQILGNADTMKDQIDDNDPISSPLPPSNVLVVPRPVLLILSLKHQILVEHFTLNLRSLPLSAAYLLFLNDIRFILVDNWIDGAGAGFSRDGTDRF
jgi:hypothetical protein